MAPKSPKRTTRKASPTDRSIPLSQWNYVLSVVQSVDTVPQRTTGTDRNWIRLVEMDEAVGPEESSEFRDRTATALYWDFNLFMWRRTDPAHVITIVTDPWKHLVIHPGQRLLVWFHRQSGKHIPINPPTFRHVITVADHNGDYPDPEDFPNVYPIGHVKSSYPAPTTSFTVTPTHQVLSSIPKHLPDPPHGGTLFVGDVTGWVFNLAGQGDDTYIPEGTVIPSWFHNGEWWTYFIGVFDESSSSSSSSVSTASSTSSVSTASTSSTSSHSVVSSSSIICEQVGTFAGIAWNGLPGYDASKKQALIHDHGCWEWQTIKEC